MANGTLDPTFGSGGKVVTDTGFYHQARTLVVQPDGKIVALGWIFNQTPLAYYFVLVRYNANGSLDTTFGVGGKAFTAISLDPDQDMGITLQPDGKIVFVGSLPINSHNDLLIVRMNANGSLDSTFGTGGIVITNQAPRDHFDAVAIQPDGKVVAVGNTDTFTVGRYNVNGSLENLFITDISDLLPGSSSSGYKAVAILPNAQILACGSASVWPVNYAVLARYNPNGTLDASFGTAGRKVVANNICIDLAVLPDGKFLIGGLRTQRFLSNGQVDPTFSSNVGGRLAILPNGHIATLSGGLTLSRSDGGVVGKYGNYQDTKADIVTQADGKIVTLGRLFSATPDTEPFTLRRFSTVTSLAGRQGDFDSDEKTDIGVFRPSNGTWYIQQSTNGFFQTSGYLGGDFIAPEDYEGFGRSERWVWRSPLSAAGQGYFCSFANIINGGVGCTPWGLFGDTPLGGDYDGDGKTDFTVFRSGVWHISQSSNGSYLPVAFGLAGDKPVPGDYDHDGKTDVAVFRPSSGTWYALRSTDSTLLALSFGIGTDKPVPGDYDGDGRTDCAVFRPGTGTWYIQQSTAGLIAQQFGISTDRPVPGDYDGDGRTDIAVFRDGTWYLLQSTDGFRVEQFGIAGDIPLSPGYVNQ